MERTHQVSRHHTRLIISAQMPMFLLRRVRSRLALSVGFGMSAVRSGADGIQEYARVRARESSKVSREPTGKLTPIDVDARPNRNSRDCSYAVTQFGIVS
jgi:hypothetical protein